MKDVRIAVAVTCSPVGKNAENIDKVARWAARARNHGAGLVCFPELNLTGYSNHPDILKAAETVPGPCSEKLAAISEKNKLILLAGLAEKTPDRKVLATHLVASPDGSVQAYRKLHLAPPEQKLFSPGKTVPLFKTETLTFGIQLCYDAHFPELATRMTLDGADVIFMPHASPRGEALQKHASWMRHLTARAYDNGVFIVAVNQVGENGKGLTFPGNAVVISPSGEIMAKDLSGKEGLLVADLRAEDLAYVRDHPMRYFLPNRRPDVYQFKE